MQARNHSMVPDTHRANKPKTIANTPLGQISNKAKTTTALKSIAINTTNYNINILVTCI